MLKKPDAYIINGDRYHEIRWRLAHETQSKLITYTSWRLESAVDNQCSLRVLKAVGLLDNRVSLNAKMAILLEITKMSIFRCDHR